MQRMTTPVTPPQTPRGRGARAQGLFAIDEEAGTGTGTGQGGSSDAGETLSRASLPPHASLGIGLGQFQFQSRSQLRRGSPTSSSSDYNYSPPSSPPQSPLLPPAPPNSAQPSPPSSPPPTPNLTRGPYSQLNIRGGQEGADHSDDDDGTSSSSSSSSSSSEEVLLEPAPRPTRMHPLSRRMRPSPTQLATQTNDVDANGDPMALRYPWLDRNGDPKAGGTEEGGITNGRSEFGGTRRGPRIALTRPSSAPPKPTTTRPTSPCFSNDRDRSVLSWFIGAPYSRRTLTCAQEGKRWAPRGIEEDGEGGWVGR